MERSLDRLPAYLKDYCTEHDTAKYTARDHAAWRYIMRRSMDFFKDHGVRSYLEGFSKAGLKIDRIPHIDEIDRCLQNYGWGAVPVVGFIPPWAFIEFQARKVLPIATDMRTVDHIAYTPAPDIVHEAAGHAPIIPDKDYSDYLAYYASLGTKAIYSKQDLRLYEAVRYLSDIKEKPESTPQLIALAEARLQSTLQGFSYTSEQALVARMSWWTAEYGMTGSLQQPKIYGAGLLSSVGESKLAMTDKVKKIRLSLDCIQYSYNITEPQPQLFVAENMHHLTDILHELDATLAYRHGGLSALQKCKECEAISTVVFDSSIAVSGCLVSFEAEGDRIDFIKYAGPVQLSIDNQEISGQGIAHHAQGFSSPVGRLMHHVDRPLSGMSASDHRQLGLILGSVAQLNFISGIVVKGRVKNLHYAKGHLLIVTWTACTVSRGSQVYFQPAWGDFDMICGDAVLSAYGGPAHRELFGEHEINHAESTPARDSPYSSSEIAGFSRFKQLDSLRFQLNANELAPQLRMQAIVDLERLSQEVMQSTPDEWLLQLEILELAQKHPQTKGSSATWILELSKEIGKKSELMDANQDLIKEGLRLIPH